MYSCGISDASLVIREKENLFHLQAVIPEKKDAEVAEYSVADLVRTQRGEIFFVQLPDHLPVPQLPPLKPSADAANPTNPVPPPAPDLSSLSRLQVGKGLRL